MYTIWSANDAAASSQSSVVVLKQPIVVSSSDSDDDMAQAQPYVYEVPTEPTQIMPSLLPTTYDEMIEMWAKPNAW